MTLKISISGVRGTVPDSLTPEVCLDFARAFGTYLGEKSKIVVGTDPRASSSFIKGVVFSGLLSTGCRVIDIGICPTPTVGIMVRELEADGGIVITASHNPLPWNGLKFMRSDGIFLNEEQAKSFLEIYESKTFKERSSRSQGKDNSGIETHINKILKAIKTQNLRRKHFRVALDCVNGAGSVICVKLLEKLGCQVEAINCDLKLPFPHPPEPVAENLKELCALVREKKADIGFALDSDADRLAIVSEQGEPIGEELSLALAVKYVLGKNKNGSASRKIVVTNLSTTRVIDDIAQSYGTTVLRTKIGEVHVAEELKNLKGLIGGEGNGGVIYPRVGFNRDAQAAMALILCFMAESGKSISALVEELPRYYMVKDKISCRDLDAAEDFMEKIKDKFKGKPLILTDGVKVLLPSGWVHVRASNTEPIIRIIAEGKDKAEVKKLVRQILDPAG